MLVACTISLCNHKYTVLGKPCATPGPMCTLEIYQCCGEPCFASAAISKGGYLPQIPRRGKHKSLRSWSPFCSLGADQIKKPLPPISSVVACISVAAESSSHMLFTGRYQITDEFFWLSDAMLLYTQNKQTPWFQFAKRTIPTERPPLVGEVSAHFSG
jgi:hypothetical protein